MKITIALLVITIVEVGAVTVALTSTNLNSPTQAQLFTGHTVNNFAGLNGLTLEVTSQGNHDNTISPNISSAGQFANSMPTVNANSEPGYTITFDGGGIWNVVGLTLTSNNNIFSRNISGTGFRVREQAQGNLVGGTWNSIIANPGGNTGQLQLNGVNTPDASVSINLPTQSQQAFNTSGFVAEASGTSITELEYIYNVLSVNNAGQAPNNLETNQPFFVDIEVVAVPEPSSSFLLGISTLAMLSRRKRAS